MEFDKICHQLYNELDNINWLDIPEGKGTENIKYTYLEDRLYLFKIEITDEPTFSPLYFLEKGSSPRAALLNHAKNNSNDFLRFMIDTLDFIDEKIKERKGEEDE